MRRLMLGALILIVSISCVGCSNENKKTAAAFDKKIQKVYETVALGELSEFLSLKEEYDALSDEQKKYVTKYEMLDEMVSEAEKVAEAKSKGEEYTGSDGVSVDEIRKYLDDNSSNPNSDSYKDTVRCSYCGKVIRSEGKNIHGTPLYNGGTLKCDYCGHKTNIY